MLDQVKIGIVVSRFNELITSRLSEGAVRALNRAGLKETQIVVHEVPGSFELPLAAQLLIESKKIDGVVALGAVIKGATDHYDYVCSTTASGLMTVQLKTGVPVGFGVLTCDTLEQALDRAGGKCGNKGADVAQAILEMVLLARTMERSKK